MLKEIWIVQPLAFARGGGSPTPCDAFDWGPADLRPHGTGRTQVVPADTLVVDPETGAVSLQPAASEIVFKDAQGIRPVCPFFELHGAWQPAGWQEGEALVCGPVTPDILAAAGLSAADLQWRVEFCNDKAFHWTQADSDRVVAVVEIPGDDCGIKPLLGVAPAGAVEPLVPAGASVPLGRVQLTCPNAAFPEFRLRFTPAAGVPYAPANLMERLAKLPEPSDAPDMLLWVKQLLVNNGNWKGFSLPAEQCVLNPKAKWPSYAFLDVTTDVDPRLIQLMPDLGRVLTLQTDPSELLRQIAGPDHDVRNLPPGLYANVTEPPKVMASLGMIDGYGDGLITCTLKTMVAQARIVSGPPDFAPDRRPPVSIADGLADRMLRADLRADAWQAVGTDVADAEIHDLMDRAFETMGLANLDALNDYFQSENASRASRPGTPYTPDEARRLLWSGKRLESLETLPLTAMARDRHRRNTAAVCLLALVQSDRHFMEKWIRTPAGPQRLYDRKMPGLMRGSDRMPLHLTRRQYDMLAAWVAALPTRPGVVS